MLLTAEKTNSVKIRAKPHKLCPQIICDSDSGPALKILCFFQVFSEGLKSPAGKLIQNPPPLRCEGASAFKLYKACKAIISLKFI